MAYRRIVAKFGTTLLTSGTDHLNLQVMATLVKQIGRLHRQEREIVIISSGLSPFHAPTPQDILSLLPGIQPIKG